MTLVTPQLGHPGDLVRSLGLPARPDVDAPWELTEVRLVRLDAGAELADADGPLFVLVTAGTVELTTPLGVVELATADAVLLHPGTTRRIVAGPGAGLAVADLGTSSPIPPLLVLPDFGQRHGGVAALIDACPLGQQYRPAGWMRSYAGLVGTAVTSSWEELVAGSAGVGDPASGAAGRPATEAGQAVSAVLAELSRHPGEAWTLDRMAAVAHVSRSSLVQHFRRSLHASPAQVLRQVRMRRARMLLAEGSRSVTQIAFAVGYGSTAAFSRAFTGQHGVPPAQWRSAPGSRHPDRREPESGEDGR